MRSSLSTARFCRTPWSRACRSLTQIIRRLRLKSDPRASGWSSTCMDVIAGDYNNAVMIDKRLTYLNMCRDALLQLGSAWRYLRLQSNNSQQSVWIRGVSRPGSQEIIHFRSSTSNLVSHCHPKTPSSRRKGFSPQANQRKQRSPKLSWISSTNPAFTLFQAPISGS